MARKPGKKASPRSVRPRRQIRRICNVVPSRDTEKDWKFEDAVQAGMMAAVAAPPPSKDLRAAWWTIGDQIRKPEQHSGDHQRSCSQDS